MACSMAWECDSTCPKFFGEISDRCRPRSDRHTRRLRTCSWQRSNDVRNHRCLDETDPRRSPRTVLDSPNKDRRAERRSDTRAEILQAAWQLCAANGLASLSMRDLARHV